jgi:hypothetical protein
VTETVVSHHVDGLELTCSVPQVALLMDRRTDRLEDRLAANLRDARRHPQQAVLTGWSWDVSADSEPVLLLPYSLRKRRIYALECSAWAAFVAPARSVVPRVTVQLRSWFLRAESGGALGAYERVRAWVERHLLPLVDGVPPGEEAVWRIARLDIAADVAGVHLALDDLDRFTTRARCRDGHVRPLDESATTRNRGRRFTGFTFGSRGAPLYCRVYDKTYQAASDDPIRERWRTNGWNDEEAVWRVEFEARSQFLRNARTGEANRLDADPARLLSEQLDALWQHLTRKWLVLREVTGNTRIERRAPAAWWQDLAELADLDPAVGRQVQAVARVARENLDVMPLLRQATGMLAAIGATQGTAQLDDLIGALRAHILGQLGEAGFAERVARARLRRMVAGRVSAAAVEAEARRLLGGAS